jgi:hypothetical protein
MIVAVARPIPNAAPAMIATLPASLPMGRSSVLCN